MEHRYELSSGSFKVGDKVEACQTIQYGSGAIVAPGAKGIIRRVLPYVGVGWEYTKGVKAVMKPRTVLKKQIFLDRFSRWASCAPDTLVITANRELCEQVATMARKLGEYLPEEVRDTWTVGTACGAPPGVGKTLRKGQVQWPFPVEETPRILVATPEFMGYFYHTRNLPLWAHIRCIVYDEVDEVVRSSLACLERIKVMTLRSMREWDHRIQMVAVTATLPSGYRRSPRSYLGNWLSFATNVLPRPEFLHRAYPMLWQTWRKVPQDTDKKIKVLVEELSKNADVRGRLHKLHMREKTIIFVNDVKQAQHVAEQLSTTYGIAEVGIFAMALRNDLRRERLQMFRDGRIRVMVCTDALSRGLDIPDIGHVIQFNFSRNIVNHLGRVGRACRAGRFGRATNFYDDSIQGARVLAEVIQDIDKAPLDALFSRRGGFTLMMRRTELYKEMLEGTGMPIPQHLQSIPAGRDSPQITGLPDMLKQIGPGKDAEGSWEYLSSEDQMEAERIAEILQGGPVQQFDEGHDEWLLENAKKMTGGAQDREYWQLMDEMEWEASSVDNGWDTGKDDYADESYGGGYW